MEATGTPMSHGHWNGGVLASVSAAWRKPNARNPRLPPHTKPMHCELTMHQRIFLCCSAVLMILLNYAIGRTAIDARKQ